jgi:hypothetical protein
MFNVMRLPLTAFIPSALTLTGIIILLGAQSAMAQDAGSNNLPDAAILALRGKPGDIVNMEATLKETTVFHLEALASEFSTESSAKQKITFVFRGKGPGGNLQLEVRGAAGKIETDANGKRTVTKIPASAALYTLKPSTVKVKVTPLSTNASKNGKPAQAGSPQNPAAIGFNPIPFPEKALKAGDSWSGRIAAGGGDPSMQGVIINYQANLVGFEMYQSFPCARVEYNFSYKGPFHGLEAQLLKQGAPKGGKISSIGQLTGSSTVYFTLDRGYPLDDNQKMNINVTFTLTANQRTLELGGSIDSDSHAAVTAYPAYEPSLVPTVSSDASK